MVDRLAELGALQYAAANTATASVNPSRIAASGYIHAMYAEYVTWSLANPGVNPSRLSAKGRIFGYFYDNATFSPLSLFAASEVGAWYDPSDISTMFQDSAGTTPVTADGQPVGKILDKSGRGNHATQATAASRPLYKTDGTYHWLQFDGVDDSLSTGAIDFTSTDKMGVFVGAEFVTSADSTFITELSANALGNAGAFYLKSTDSGSNYLQAATNTTSYLYGNSSVISRPSTKVIAQLIDTSIAPDQPANQLKLRVNASPETLSLTGYMPAGNFGTYPLYIASRAGVSYYFGGRIYSMIIRGALSTPQEITDTETWVNSKTGAY